VRKQCLRVLVVLACASWVYAETQPPLKDPRSFRSSVELTTVTATVTDKDGRLITGLDRDAFDLFEDGDRQTITQFTRERVPVSLGLLLDVSDSMFGQRLKDARIAVEHFLFDLLDPADQYFLLAFNHEPHVLTKWTTTSKDISRALDEVRPFGGTAVYDAVVAALPMMERRGRQRAAIVVISDGADTASDAALRDVRAALLRSDAFVYAIAIDSSERQPINTRIQPGALREITSQSGGLTEVVHDAAGLDSATRMIAEELSHQYLLGYTSTRAADGQFHSIRVRVRGTDYRVRARTGYVAAPITKPSG
jgi:Ca-activated chloride channel family protein